MATRIFNCFFQGVQSTDVSRYVTPEDNSSNLPALVEPNWTDNPSLTTSWLTDVARGLETGAEDRRSRRARPRRALTYQITGFDSINDEREPNYASRILSSIMKLSKGPTAIPLVMDRSFLTREFDPSESTLMFFNPEYRRFFEGQRVAVIPKRFNRPTVQGFKADFLEGRVARLFPGEPYVEIEGIDQPLPKGSVIFPMMDCNFLPNASLRRLTNSILDGDLTFTEFGSAGTLPPSTVLPLVSDFKLNLIDGNPIFDVPLTGDISLLLNRSGQFVNIGNGGIETLVGERPKFGYSATVIWKERREFFRLLQWFDWARGRAKEFWFRNPYKLYDLIKVESSTSILVKPLAYSFDIKTFWPYLCLLLNEGTEQFRVIDTVTQTSNGLFRITTQEEFSTNIKLATSGHLGRFNSDAFTETWITLESGFGSIEVTETLDEEDIIFNE